jgi:hypothetical protein
MCANELLDLAFLFSSCVTCACLYATFLLQAIDTRVMLTIRSTGNSWTLGVSARSVFQCSYVCSAKPTSCSRCVPPGFTRQCTLLDKACICLVVFLACNCKKHPHPKGSLSFGTFQKKPECHINSMECSYMLHHAVVMVVHSAGDNNRTALAESIKLLASRAVYCRWAAAQALRKSSCL